MFKTLIYIFTLTYLNIYIYIYIYIYRVDIIDFYKFYNLI